MSTDPNRITAPRSRQTILDDIAEYLQTHGLDMEDFETVDGAMQAVWPEVYKLDKLATLVVTINVYLALAERFQFEVIPPYLKKAKLEGIL